MGSLEKRYAEALLSLADNAEQADVVGSALGVLGRLYQKNSDFRNFILNPVISQQVRSETLMGILEMLGYIKDGDDAGGDAEKDDTEKMVNEIVDDNGANEDNAANQINQINEINEINEDNEESEITGENAGNEVFVADAGVMLLRFLQLLLEKGRLAFLPNIADEYNKIKAKHRSAIHIVARSASPLDSDELYGICEKYRVKYGSASADIDNIVEPSMMGEISVQIGGMRVDDTLYGRLAALSRAVAGGAVRQTAEAGYMN